MSLLARAPFLAVLFALSATLAVSEHLALCARLLFSLLMACGFVLCLAVPRKEERRVFLSILCLAAGASLWASLCLARRPALPVFLKTTGTVTEVRPWGAVYAAAVSTPEGGFVLKLPFATLREGEKIALEGKVRAFRGAQEKSGKSDFREDRFWRGRGMAGHVNSPKTEVLPGGGWNLYRWRHGL